MKTFIPKLNFIFVSILLIYGCGNEPREKETQRSTVPDSSAMDMLTKSSGAPLGGAEYQVLTLTARSAYTYADPEPDPEPKYKGNHLFPGFVEPVINLDDFLQYLHNETFEGIRLYPGFDIEKNNMVFIICQANISDNSEDKYIILKKDDYKQEGALGVEIVQRNPAGVFHEDYMKNIMIYFDKQSDPRWLPPASIKYSRWYSGSAITKFITDNITGIPESYKGYYIRFEFGYINSNFIQNLMNRNPDPANSPEEVQGFTAVMSLVDEKGNVLANSRATFNPEEPDDYREMNLEVGSPCPPRCGMLHE